MRFSYRPAVLAILTVALGSCDAVEDVVDVVDPQPDLEIAIGASTLEVAPGYEVVFTVVASNRGPAAATDVVVSIPVPDEIDRIFDAPPGTTCGGGSDCNSVEVIEWTLGTLAAGQSRTLAVGIPVDRSRFGFMSGLHAVADTPSGSSSTGSRAMPVLD